MSQIHKFDTFSFQTLLKLTRKLVKRNVWKIVGDFWDLLYVGGGLIEKGAYLKSRLRGEGLLEAELGREGGLVELLRYTCMR